MDLALCPAILSLLRNLFLHTESKCGHVSLSFCGKVCNLGWCRCVANIGVLCGFPCIGQIKV